MDHRVDEKGCFLGRSTAEDACDESAFFAVVITSDILVKKILQTIDCVNDNGGYTRTYNIALRSEYVGKPSFRLLSRQILCMSAADKGFIGSVLLCDYNMDHFDQL